MRARPLLACLLPLAAACAHQISVVPAAQTTAAPVVRVTAPLQVERVDVTDRFGRFAANDGFVNRIVMDLRRTRAFSTVLPPRAAPHPDPESVRLRVDLYQTVDERYAANFLRAFGVGLSMLLLAPVLPFEIGYRTEVEARAMTCDGWSKDFYSAADGELRYYFLGNEIEGRRDLANEVTERALAGALAQLTGDAALAERVEGLRREGDCPRERKTQ